MSTRSYANLILLESVLDSIPDGNNDVLALASTVFEPYVPVVEQDCGTTLGRVTDVTYSLEGKVELATDNFISHDRIRYLLSQGIYSIGVRDISSCISTGGICQKCYHASRQYDPIPAVGTSVQVFPEFVTYTDALPVHAGDTTLSLNQTPDLYDRVYVYYEGTLLNPALYTISGSTLNLSSAVPRDGYIVARYTSIIRAPFLFWLAGTYSGSLLGIKQLPAQPLPIHKRLLSSLIPTSVLESVANEASTLKGLPSEALDYLPKVSDPLEKAILVIALYSVYLNVN